MVLTALHMALVLLHRAPYVLFRILQGSFRVSYGSFRSIRRVLENGLYKALIVLIHLHLYTYIHIHICTHWPKPQKIKVENFQNRLPYKNPKKLKS